MKEPAHAVKFTNQIQCREIISKMQLEKVFTPLNGQPTCDVILQFGDNLTGKMRDEWIIGSNDNGTFTIWLMFNTTYATAWAFFRTLRPGVEYDFEHHDSRKNDSNIHLN